MRSRFVLSSIMVAALSITALAQQRNSLSAVDYARAASLHTEIAPDPGPGRGSVAGRLARVGSREARAQGVVNRAAAPLLFIPPGQHRLHPHRPVPRHPHIAQVLGQGLDGVSSPCFDA